MNKYTYNIIFSIKFFLLFVLISGITEVTTAQDEYLEYTNKVYVDYIASVQFHPYVRSDAYEDLTDNFFLSTNPVSISATTRTNSAYDLLSEPVVELNDGYLHLKFDDLEGDAKNYVYTFVHCNADWTPSDLTDLDYINGFAENNLDEYDFSLNTTTLFTNYSLILPNDEVSWTKSGNYLLKVYNTDNDKKLVLTRRFMVVEQKMIVDYKFLPARGQGQFDTHQSLVFEVFHENIRVDNPATEIKVVVRQNDRWDTAITRTQPRYDRNDRLFYDKLGDFTFGGGKEFRFLDLRSLKNNRSLISRIEEFKNGYEVTLLTEEPRAFKSYLRSPDFGGKFVIENLDRNGPQLRSDYADVLFSLAMNLPLEDHDVYLAGEFTDWGTNPKYKMTWNPLTKTYLAKISLKQGAYYYMYAALPKNGNPILDIGEMEGNWYETENEYSIMVYHRPFGSRYDQLLAYARANNLE